MKPSQEFFIIHQTVMESWLRDASTFALFVALIGTGVLLNSVALQWVGAIVGFVTVLCRGAGFAHRLTITDARKELDRIEAELTSRPDRSLKPGVVA